MSFAAQFEALRATLHAELDEELGAGGAASATFALPSGYSVLINQTGINEVRQAGTLVGSGGIALYYTPATGPVQPLELTSSAAAQVSATELQVTHTYTGPLAARATYRLIVEGDDVRVVARVRNLGTTTIEQIGLGSPGFPITWPAAFPASIGFDTGGESYPSAGNPSAGMFMVTTSNDRPFNFSLYPVQDVHERFGIRSRGLFPHGTSLIGVFYRPIGPGGEEVYELVYRFSDSTDWKVLLARYKDHVRAQLPTLQYQGDARPLGQFSSLDAEHIRPDNPFGYNDGGDPNAPRRFDLHGQPFVDWVEANMDRGHFQAMIFWQFQGMHPRGVFYRPDFNVMTPAHVASLQTIVAGLPGRVGLQSRPNVLVTSSEVWGNDRAMPIGSDARYVEDLLNKYEWATGLGVTHFYIDSAATNPDDHVIMRRTREKVGPAVQTYAEFNTVLSAAYSACYSEWWYENGALRCNQRQFDLIRWIWPESMWLGKFRDNLPPGGTTQIVTELLTRRLSPMIEDWQIVFDNEGWVTALETLVPTYINAQHQWI